MAERVAAPTVRGALVVLVALVVATALQLGLLPHLALAGVVPDIVLLVVVASALALGSERGALAGLVGGLLLDAAPPADHVLGRWALALAVVGWLAGSVRHDAGRSRVAAAVLVGACSFLATSVFALSGLLLGDPGVTVDRVLLVLPLAVAYDVALAIVLLRPLGGLVARSRRRRPSLPSLAAAR